MDNIHQKIISNNGNMVTEFVVLSKKEAKENDWVSGNKFMQVNEKGLTEEPINYELRSFRSSNVDEGREGHNGKALSAFIKDSNVQIDIYECSTKDDWKLSRGYELEKSVYDAYVLTFRNNTKVEELEKKEKAKQKFDLVLG